MSTRTQLEERLARNEASLDIAYETYDKLLAEVNESYRFDSGEGSQSTKKRDIEALRKQINTLESEIDGIRRRLKGLGLTRITLSRKSHYRNY